MDKVSFSGENLTLEAISLHQADLDQALTYYYDEGSPAFQSRFFGYSPSFVSLELAYRIGEVDMASSMTVLAALEAAFRIDYLQRCYRKQKDPLSRRFRDLYRKKKERASLEDEILEIWKESTTVKPTLVSELRGAFKLRHWLAHGRYWVPKLGRPYDFIAVYALADQIFETFPLEGLAN